jgi:4-hydroxybenzoate polyprenyltransferase
MYSFWLKQKLLLDVFVLTLLYTLRIIAGIAAIQVAYSEWLIIFSIFFFLSLAFLKRYIELSALTDQLTLKLLGRNYHKHDTLQLSIFGIVSGYLATLVFALYINSEQIKVLYRHPEWLWSVCFLLLYWISRIWMLANRGRVYEDPVVFVLKDRMSYCVVSLIVSIIVLSSIDY